MSLALRVPRSEAKAASRSPTATLSLPAETVRAISLRARTGTRPARSDSTAGTSRTAKRYESVATIRSRPLSDSKKTPVSTGRASSVEAATLTCPIASTNAAPSTPTAPLSEGSVSLGKSAVANSRKRNTGPPPLISISPPSA